MRIGVTLIELIIVIVIVGVLTFGLAKFIIQIVDTWRFVDFRNEVAQEGKKALDWMVREIREIKDNDSILLADRSQLRFINSDEDTIEYLLSGNSVMRSVNGGTDYPLCDYVSDLEFEYRNSGGTVLTPLPLPPGRRRQIKSIKVSITLRRGNQSIEFFSVVFPRSL